MISPNPPKHSEKLSLNLELPLLAAPPLWETRVARDAQWGTRQARVALLVARALARAPGWAHRAQGWEFPDAYARPASEINYGLAFIITSSQQVALRSAPPHSLHHQPIAIENAQPHPTTSLLPSFPLVTPRGGEPLRAPTLWGQDWDRDIHCSGPPVAASALSLSLHVHGARKRWYRQE